MSLSWGSEREREREIWSPSLGKVKVRTLEFFNVARWYEIGFAVSVVKFTLLFYAYPRNSFLSLFLFVYLLLRNVIVSSITTIYIYI